MNLKDFIRSTPEDPKKGILFKNIITIIKSQNTFAKTINQIVEKSKKYNFIKVDEIESKVFVFVSAISYILKNFYCIKKIKLNADVHSLDFEPEYE